MAKKEILKAENLYRSYRADIEVLKGLDFEIYEQEFVGIMGRSGSGKTTLLKLLGLIDLPTKGDLFFMGENTRKIRGDKLAKIRRNQIGFVYQDYYLMDSLTVLENIMLPMVLDHTREKECYKRAKRQAKYFGLSHLIEKNPYELSGGEKQRVAICRALINDPEVIFADEPTGNLDLKSAKMVIQTLEKINRELKKSVVLVTHDPYMASYCTRILLIKDGRIVRDVRRKSSQEEFYEEVIELQKDTFGE